MATTKFYLLYKDESQSKLFTMASTEEILKNETEYYSDGVWFEYDQKDGSNLLLNEKKMKGIKFSDKPKEREYKEFGSIKKIEFKWVD